MHSFVTKHNQNHKEITLNNPRKNLFQVGLSEKDSFCELVCTDTIIQMNYF